MLPACPFPPIHWMRMAIEENPCQINVHENYIKQTYRNRYDILSANGPVSLTIPVSGQKGQKIPTKDIRIADHRWVRNHLAALRSAYSRSPYFEFFADEINPIYESKPTFLIDFSFSSLQWINRYIPQLKFTISSNDMPFNQLSAEEQFRLLAFEPATTWPETPAYVQVFADRFAFQPNLSTLDMLMNLGPRAADYILFTKNREQANH